VTGSVSSHQQSEARGILYVFITSLLWGTTGTVQTVGPPGIDPLVVGPFRIIIGGILIALWSRSFHQRSEVPWSPAGVLIGAVLVAGFQLSFFSAVARTGVVVATITSIGTTPIFAGFFGRVFLKEPLRPVWYVATVISIVGVVLLSESAGTVRFDPAGLWLALLAGASYAGQTIAIRWLVRYHPPEMVMARLFLVASVLVLPLLFLRPMGWLWSLHGVSTVLYLGVIPTAVAYIFFSKGLRSVDGATAGTVSLTEPATASMFGFFLLGETISSGGALGIALIAVSLVLISAGALVRGRRIPAG
jgi:drug/metabolite transporter, DME family